MKSIFDVFMEVIFDAFFFLKAASDNDFIFFQHTQLTRVSNSLPRCRANTNNVWGKESPTSALWRHQRFGNHHWTDCYTLLLRPSFANGQRKMFSFRNGGRRWRRYDEVLFSLYRSGSSYGSFTVTSVAKWIASTFLIVRKTTMSKI